MTNTELISTLQDRIETGVSAGGHSWTTVEELCLSVLALRDRRREPLDSALRQLSSLQLADGSWPCFPGDGASAAHSTALGILASIVVKRDWSHLESQVRWLLNAKGREAHWLWRWKLQNVDTSVRFDPQKYGWSWMPGTTSWVIPTSFSLIALQTTRRAGLSSERLDERIELGIGMLVDRMCPGGGWNAGNGVAFGVAFTPYIDATAIALLALQSHECEAVDASLLWLRGHLPSCPSPYSLAWGILALAAYERKGFAFGNSLDRALRRLATTIPEPEPFTDRATLAVSTLALSTLDGDNVFAVQP